MCVKDKHLNTRVATAHRRGGEEEEEEGEEEEEEEEGPKQRRADVANLGRRQRGGHGRPLGESSACPLGARGGSDAAARRQPGGSVATPRQ
ncbi:unnamed protein product [Prorocentrum cordatum]|uniref:Uncharacterized protein n=1 Tax=Prorocentrum cordatum TaxID=2364126 RepID=A0ABN9Y4E7_9DINO|nr:unnamed protein product [Polarella glacialis]